MDTSTGDRAVIGAGLVGHGIGQVLAREPGTVWLYDVSSEALHLALMRIRDSLDMLTRHGLLDNEASDEILGRISPTTDIQEAVQRAWFIVEAAPEDRLLKQRLFAELERHAPEDAILATNTSGLRIRDVAAHVRHPERVVGSHFFLPAQVIPIVEVSRGPATSDETMDRTVVVWRACGKEPIRVERDIPGHLANRIQGALVREATSLLGDGVATAEDIDKAVRMGFGLRYLVSGPLEQRDLGGLDLHVTLVKEVWPDLNNSLVPHQFVVDKVKRGELGVKSGKGFHDWTGQNPEKVRTERNEALVEMMARLRLLK